VIVVSDVRIRRGAAQDQIVLDLWYSRRGDETFSLSRDHARELAQQLLDIGGFEVVWTASQPEPDAA
jgi:hypothetical protein